MGEPKDRNNLVTLHEHVEMQLHALEKATTLARETMELRLIHLNEIRQQLNDQAKLFLLKEVYEKGHDALATRVESLQLTRAELAGKASQSAVALSVILAFAGILLSCIALLIEVVRNCKGVAP